MAQAFIPGFVPTGPTIANPQSKRCWIDHAAIDADLASGRLKPSQLHDKAVMAKYDKTPSPEGLQS